MVADGTWAVSVPWLSRLAPGARPEQLGSWKYRLCKLEAGEQ